MEESVQNPVLTLDKLAIGDEAVVIKVNGEGRIRRRLFDMGVTPGARILMKKRAPLGDPIEISIRGYELTLRKMEAVLAEVKLLEPEGKE